MTQSFDEWVVEYRKDKNRSDNDWYPNQVQVFQAGAQSKQAEIDELQKEIDSYKCIYGKLKLERNELRKRIDDALKAMEAESENSWGLWKEKADMYEQGASNAYEKSYWILKGTTDEL